MNEEKLKLVLWDRFGKKSEHWIELGANLREALMSIGANPDEKKFVQLNCKGMGICGTCKVLVCEGEIDWEKRSCQIQCFQDMEIRLK